MTVLCMLLFVACLSDYRSIRIPNILIGIILLWGIFYRYWDLGAAGIGEYLRMCLLVLLMMYPLFRIGAIGAGDVKLFATTAGYLSGHIVPDFLFYSLLIAAIFSMVKIIKQHNGKERLQYLESYIAEVVKNRQWRLYPDNKIDKGRSGICLSGPVLLSILIHLGGVY